VGGANAVAVGYGAVANASAVSIGQGAGIGSGGSGGPVSIGQAAVAQDWGVAIGQGAVTNGNWGTAVGNGANASLQNSVALGNASLAKQNGIALGSSATNAGNNQIAIGYAAATTADNQLVIGGSATNGSYVSTAYLGSGVTDTAPQSVTLQGTGGSGTNIAGATFNLAGGKSTGSANGGSINLQISAPGGAGSTLNGLTTVATFSGATGSATFTNAVNSATAFQIQSASASETLFSANTTTRTSGVTGNMIKIGNSTGTDTALTVLQLDSTTANPTTNLASLNGGMFYNSTTNKISIIENGQIKIICNTTDLGCGTGTVTQQIAYTNSTGGTTPEILLDSTRGGVDIQDANSTIGASQALLAVRGSASATTLGTAYLQVVGDGRVGVGGIASGVQLNVAGGTGITALKVQGGNATSSAGGDGIQATGGSGANTTAGGTTSGFGGANSLVGGNGGTATGSNSYGGWGGATALTSGNGGTSSLYHGGDGGAVAITGGNGGASSASIDNYAGGGGNVTLQAGNGAESGGAALGGAGGNVNITAGTAGFLQTGGSVNISSAGASFGGSYGNVSLNAGTGGSIIAAATTSTAFKIQNAGGSETLLTANTMSRAAGTAGNTVKIGNSTGTDAALTILQLDSATANPTTNLTSINGGLFYNSTTNKVSIIENGSVKVLCNTTDLGCASGSTLASAYTASTGGSTSEIILDSTRGGVDIQDITGSTVGATAALFAVRASGGASTLGNLLFDVQGNGRLGVNMGTASATASYDLSFGNGANRTIGVESVSSGSARSLTIQGGATSVSGATAGALSLLGGGTFGGTVNVNGGATDAKADTGGSISMQAGVSGGSMILEGGVYTGGTGVQTGANIILTPGLSSDGATDGVVQIGSKTADSVGHLLILDTKNTAGDPTVVSGLSGAMYFNSNIGVMRCYINGFWQHCNDPTRLANGYNVQEEFIGAAPGSNNGQGWTCGTSSVGMGTTHSWNCNGTGSNSTIAAVVADSYQRPGQIQLSTGTSASDNSIIMYLGGGNGPKPFVIGGGETYETAVNIPTLGSTAERYVIRVGLCDASEGSNVDCTNGVYFEYDSATSANWRYATAAASTRTKTSSTKAVATGWTNLKWVANSSTSISFYAKSPADSSYILLGTATTAASIPTTSGNATRMMIGLYKTGGTGGLANRTVTVDYMDYYNDFLSRR
jgi:hypothetical protein